MMPITFTTAVYHMASHYPRWTALIGAWVTWNLGMVVETSTDSSGLGLLTQLGAGGAIAAFLFYMLRRSEARGDADRQALDLAERALVKELHDQIARLQEENATLRIDTKKKRGEA